MFKGKKKQGFVQYYGIYKDGQRRILSFKVDSKQDAREALRRLGQASGWFVERDRQGAIITNDFISL